MIPALLTTLLFAGTAVCATQAALRLGGIAANAARLAVALGLLGFWAHACGGGLGGGAVGAFMLAGAVGFGLGGLCMFQALPRIGSTLGLLVVESAAAFSSGLLAWAFLGAALSGREILLCLLILGGVVLAFAPYRLPGAPRRVLLTGALFAALAALGQGVSWTLTKAAFNQVAAAGGDLGALTAAYQRLLGGFAVAMIAFVWLVIRRRGLPENPRTALRPAIPWVIANALAGPVFGVACMLWAIRQVGNPGVVQSIVATATLVSIPLSRKLEERRFGLPYVSGATISLLGIAALLLS